MDSDSCLTDDQIRKIVESVCSHEEQSRHEAHLDVCANCQRRLMAFSGEMPEHVAQSEPPSSSQRLSDVMEQLRSISPAVDDATQTNQSTLFSYLDPPQQDGSLGRIGNYEVMSLLGRGGMGEVFVAFDPVLRREVAVKVPSPSALQTQDAHDRLVREARALAAVQHDNIVTVYSAEVIGGVLLLVMERIHGQSLAERLKKEQKLPWTDVLSLGKQVAAALVAAHGVGVVHRDITPGNLLLEESTGRVKVSDFGLARSQEHGAITASSLLVGTPEYMSPEQATEACVGPLSDLFSLGTVLYEACSGKSPFRAKTVLSTLRRVSEESLPALHDVDPSIPDWFSDLVARLMSKDPSDRPASAADLLGLLENEVQETTSSVADTGGTATRRRRLLAILGLCLVVIPFGFYAWSQSGPERDNVPTVDPAPSDNDEPGFFVESVGKTFRDFDEALAAASDGDSIEVRGSGTYPVEGSSLGSKANVDTSGSRSNSGVY